VVPADRRVVRAFVAVEVGEDARGAPAHVTLAFLGTVAAASLPSIRTALARAAAGGRPFDLGLGGIGAFPDVARPRVVWTGVTEGRADVEALAAAVRRELTGAGVPFDPQPFHPHVTLLRVRSPGARARARRLLDGLEPAPAARSVRVTEIRLNESELAPGGAVHRVVATFALGVGTGALAQPADAAPSVTHRRQR
jgi:RNA 2',3'-cyclic 3'-phosphodiesterase